VQAGSLQPKGAETVAVTSIEAFEKFLRTFKFIACGGGILIAVGVGLGVALSPNGWGWTAGLCTAGALSVVVGVRETIRGRKILVRLRETKSPT
jgi:hypothetical protein